MEEKKEAPKGVIDVAECVEEIRKKKAAIAAARGEPLSMSQSYANVPPLVLGQLESDSMMEVLGNLISDVVAMSVAATAALGVWSDPETAKETTQSLAESMRNNFLKLTDTLINEYFSGSSVLATQSEAGRIGTIRLASGMNLLPLLALYVEKLALLNDASCGGKASQDYVDCISEAMHSAAAAFDDKMAELSGKKD